MEKGFPFSQQEPRIYSHAFGLTIAPATFQHFIKDILGEYLDIFCRAFIDNILIYSDTLAERKLHVHLVLKKLNNSGLYLKPEKYEFI